MSIRVAGCDPGTTSLDIVIIDKIGTIEQIRFSPSELRENPTLPIEWLSEHQPLDLIAGPSGYGLPWVWNHELTDAQLDLMSLVRKEDRGTPQGVSGFSAMLRAFRVSTLPTVFLPGVIHLPTVPSHRKLNRIDMGTADKLCVAALAIRQFPDLKRFALLEIGSAFTALLLVDHGQIIHGFAGSAGPMGGQSGGSWDGEVAYWLSPLRKGDLFHGGVADHGSMTAEDEGLLQAVFGLRSICTFDTLIISGKRGEDATNWPRWQRLFTAIPDLRLLPNLPGAWVKAAAQGAALIALGAVEQADWWRTMRLIEASGTVLDWLTIRPQPSGA